MKRAGYIVFAALATVLLLGSCRELREPMDPSLPEKDCIVLRLGSAPLSEATKVGSERGDNYNENLIESIDLFFYPSGGTGSNAVLSALGRGVEAKMEADSVVYTVSVHYTETQAEQLFGSTTGGTCQVYAIANANVSYSADTRVETLKQQLIERDFTMAEVQNSFVMSSDGTYTVTQSLDGNGNASAAGRVKMKRSAAKAQLFLRFLESIPDGSDPNRVWKPDLNATHTSSGVYVDLLNIAKKGRVDAEYDVQDADYASFQRRSIGPRNTYPESHPAVPSQYDVYDWTATPFYSYPVSWSDIDEHTCVYLIHVPWYPVDTVDGVEVEGSRSEYRTYQVGANVVDLKFERNHCYRTFVYIQSLGGVDKEQFVVVPECDYYICPWVGSGEGVEGVFSDFKYLVIDNPEEVLDAEETVYFNYVSSSNIQSVTITRVLYYDNAHSNNNTPPLKDLRIGQSGFDTAITDITCDYSTTPGVVSMTHSLSSTLGRYGRWEVWATITNQDGISESVHFVQNPPIRLECNYVRKGDVFVDGFFVRVKNATFGVDITINGETFKRGPGTVSGNTLSPGSYTVNGTSYNYTNYGSISRGTDSYANALYTTEINVSAFNTDNNSYSFSLDGVNKESEYRIGDPRMEARDVYDDNWRPYPYLTYWNGTNNNDNTYGVWQDPGSILITSKDEEEQNLIAPRFLISSGLNSQGTKPNSYDNSVQRAATYQEAGYPAGRWRLPTEAEIAFIIARQAEGAIPNLFTTESSGYWTASAKRLELQSATSFSFSSVPNNSSYSSRFIYDLWYWGDEPSTTNVYHPNGHILDYDAAGNATPRE